MIHLTFAPKLRQILWLLAAVALLCNAIAGAEVFADGSVRVTRFDPALSLNASGRRVFVTGTVECTQGEKVQLHLTISQRLTGAVAEGNWKGVCTGNPQVWETDAVTQADGKFQLGAAQAVGFGVTISQGKPTDAIQWFDDITLL